MSSPYKIIDYVSFPMGLAPILTMNNRQLKAASILYQLKSIYVGGIIFDYKKQLDVIADSFGYSKRKLIDYIKMLKEESLAVEDNNGRLSLRSSKYIAQHFGLGQTGFHKIKKSDLADIETYIKALALQENLKTQEYNLEAKVMQKEIKAKVGIINPAALNAAADRRMRKAMRNSMPELIKNQQERYIQAITTFQKPEDNIFPFITLSRQGIAKVVNRKSKSTGHRLAKKMVKLGYIADKAVSYSAGSYTWTEYNLLQENVLAYNPSYTYKAGEIIKVMPNNISMSNKFSN